MWVANPSLHDHLHRVEVIPLHFEIRYPAVPLGGLHIAVPKEILDGAEIGICIEQLRGHRVPEMVTGNPEFCFTGIILHALLDAANGNGIALTGPFFDQKDPGGFGARPYPEIIRQSEERIIAHIDNPVFRPLAIFDDDFSLFEVHHTQSEMSHFLHTKAAPEHQHEHGQIPMPLHNGKDGIDLLIPQVPGKRLGHLENVTPPNRIHDGYMLLVLEIVIKLADTVHMTVDRLGHEPLSHQVIDVLRDLRVCHALYRHIQPNDKGLDGIQVVLNLVRRAVPSLQKSSPVHEAVVHHCGYHPFLSWTWP